MKHLIKIFSVIAFLAIMSSQSFAQSESDYKKGNFTLPSYKLDGDCEDYTDRQECYYVFNDGTKGKLFYSKEYSKYYIQDVWKKIYYPSLSTTIKALYAYKKCTCIMDGKVD